jgi:hypothetical protein
VIGSVTIAGVVSVLSLSGLPRTPSAAAAACSDTKTSTMYVKALANEYQYDTTISSSGTITTSPPYYIRNNVNTGYSAVTVLGCKNPKTGAWSALSYGVDQIHNDLVLTYSGKKVAVKPRVRDRGYGVFVTRTTSNQVMVEAMVCASKPKSLTWLGALKFVTGLPIPAKISVNVGLYLANRAIPSGSGPTYACGQMGTASIPWSFTSSGVAKLKMPSTGHYLYTTRASWQNACTVRYCGTTNDHVVEVRAGR